MPIRVEDVVRLGTELVAEISNSVDAHVDKVKSFLEDDDWSLVIKLHALIEASLTQLIVSKTDDALQKVVERLPLSDNSIGKGRMALDMGLISDSQYRFLRKFSELRNDLVHKVSNVDFNLQQYVDCLDSNQRKGWKTMLAWSLPGAPDQTPNDEDLLYPRTGLYLSVLRLVMVMATDEQLARINKKTQLLSDETERKLLLKDV
ncbi:hypothetical protein [Pseudomonas sp. 58 R 12]|uniref:hypothetical protein n=1 Tax=Pseudomonas sp. 58 R 12 TaxID=1844107 RepID=UPI0008127754|nr:hypothetical protein [Pseudomonas sp. 58 R 12]CRM21545.1 hypothetical protein [Pseudomonas sp. 58 R 12]